MKNAIVPLIRKKNFNKLLLLFTSIPFYFIIYAPLLKIDYGDTRALPAAVNETQQHHLDTSTLTSSPIDTTINQRLPWNNEEKCDRVFLYMPYFFSGHGQGFQINCYLMAAVVSAWMDLALVILEPPRDLNRFDTQSQFGCPADIFEDKDKKKLKDGFPEGLLRLIQHPNWISRGCGVPTCGGTRFYNEWVALKDKQREQWIRRGRKRPPLHFNCNENGRNIQVFPMDGADLRTYWDRLIEEKMVDRSSPESRQKAYNWAIRLGATPEEAEYFTTLQSKVQISDYIGALVNRSGLLKFQPWIERDVAEYIGKSDLTLDASYDAVHVRRGDKLIAEARPIITMYWRKRGYKPNKMPTNYIPFKHYLELGWDQNTCPKKNNGELRHTNTPHRIIYVATDDPTTVQKEIASLPKTQFGHTILNECQKAKFIFSPASKTTDTFHITPCQEYLGTCNDDNCIKRYERNIAAMADLVILTRADKFVGDYNSNWGRIIRGFRTVFDVGDGGLLDKSPVLVRDVVEVFGSKFTFFSY